MKKKSGIFLLIFLVLFLIFACISYASVPDADGDGVPDTDANGNILDKCPNSQSSVVDQFGCTCAQKTQSNCASAFIGVNCCAASNNPCVDTCGIDNIGKAACNYADNSNSCSGGVCRNGNCVQNLFVGTAPVGWLDNANCVFIRGWAVDKDNPSVSISVQLYKDNGAGTAETLVQEIPANQESPDLNKIYPQGNHRFTIATPVSLKDGKTHQLFIQGVDASPNPNKILSGVPKTISCTGDNSLIAGTTFKAADASDTELSAPVQSGSDVKLKWTAGNSVLKIKIEDHRGNVKFERSSGPMSTGSNTQNPQESTTYILTATYPSGDVTKWVPVTVQDSKSSTCNPATQLFPHWRVKNGQCLASCGILGGTYCSVGDCPSGYQPVPNGPSGDCNSCCKEIIQSSTCAAQNGFICGADKLCTGTGIQASDSTRCCSIECVTPSWTLCSQCGNGFFNLCDRVECNSISEKCYFIPTVVSGNCNPCAGASCQSYPNSETCSENHCGLQKCTWNNNHCVDDTIAPTVSITTPSSGAIVSGTVSASATASDDTSIAGVQFTLDNTNLGAEDTTAPFSVQWNTANSPNAQHTLSAIARDAVGIISNSNPIVVSVNNVNPNSPPVRSNGLPSGSLAAGTTSTTLSLTTNKAATCKYSATANVPYASMTNGFTTTGAAAHSTTVSGLTNTNYNYYVKCRDTDGNANTDDFTISFSVAGWQALTVEQQAQLIGSMYNCPAEKPNIYFISAANVGYSYSADEASYAYAKLLNEKGCHKGSEKYVIFYVSTVNFPIGGNAAGVGSDAEQKWLDYWDQTARRFSDIGYKIIIHPLPFIINNDEPADDYPPGLRPLLKSDLNINSNEIPVVYRCKASDACTKNGKIVSGDSCYVPIASIFDPKTLALGTKFYEGINNFFSKYSAFVKISVTAPSDFGEYGFPFGVEGRWWNGGAYLGQTATSPGCFLIGDSFAPATPTLQNYNQKLNEFMQSLAVKVKQIFPGKKYMVITGYGNDVNPRDGFSYASVVNWAQANGIDLHSPHASYFTNSEYPLDKIYSAKPPNYEFTFENDFPQNENTSIRVLSHTSKYGLTGFEPEISTAYDNFYLHHLFYSMGPSANINAYPTKGITVFATNGLASLRSTYLTQGVIEMPTNDAAINGDSLNQINGWGYYNPPYDDKRSYGVRVYAGHLMPNPPEAGKIDSKHPEYMRLVGSTQTSSERTAGLGDSSRFSFNWKPNLASGKAILRIFIVNSESQIIAEHPQSPLILNIQSRITGSATLTRRDYNYPDNDCTRKFTMSGTVADSQKPNQNLDIVIIDEYRGRILAQKPSSGNSFSIDFDVPKTAGEETQIITPRAYVNTGTDLVALPTNIVYNGNSEIPNTENPMISVYQDGVFNC